MGAGGIYTTVGDLARWMANFATGKVGGPDLFERITTRNVLTTGDTTDYGFGLFIDEYRGLVRVHHGGNDVAHRSMLRYFPEIDAGVIAQSNNGGFDNNRIADRLADLFLGEHMTERSAAGAVAEGSDPSPFDPTSFDPEDFDAFAGRYALDEAPSVILRFWREEARLLTEVTGQDPVELSPTSDSTFALAGVEASVTFRRDEDGEPSSVTLHQNGDHPAQRLEGTAWAPSDAELGAYEGLYYSDELQTFYEVTLEDDGLVLRHRRFADDLQLSPGQREGVFTGDFPVTEIEFERSATGEVTGLRAGNGRARDVWFERMSGPRPTG
jgi:hypothetical protein